MNKSILPILLCLTTTTSFANPKAINVIKESIKSSLKDPDSVKFKDITVITNTKGKKSICGSYNAKNSYGGYVGYKAFSADERSGKLTSLEGLDDYILSGCAGKVAELQLIENKKKEQENSYIYERSSEICQAYGEFLIKVIKQKKTIELAYQEIQQEIEIDNLKYNAIAINNNPSVNYGYYKQYKPSIEEYTKVLHNIQSIRSNVSEIKYSSSERYSLRKVMPNCIQEQSSLYKQEM